MSSLGIVVVLNILLLSVTLAHEACPQGQYLDISNECVACSSCRPPTDVVVKPCHSRSDTVCGYLLLNERPQLPKPFLNKRRQLPSENPFLNKSAATKDETFPFFESVNSYNFMLHGPSNKSKKNNDAVKVKNIKNKLKKNDSRIDRDGLFDLTSTKFPFDKNGKHIKKDLSTVDEIFSDSNQSYQYTVRLRPGSGLENSSFKKSKSKQNKNNDSGQLGKDDEWMRHVVPHIENHRIVVDVKEDTKLQKKSSAPALQSFKDSDESKKTLAFVLEAAERMKNKTRQLDFDDIDGDVLKRTYENVIDEDTDEEYDDSNNNNDNTNNNDDDDDDDDEDEDEDDENDEDDEDEDYESEQSKDGDEDKDFDGPFSKKVVPFGVDPNVFPMSVDNDADDEDSEEFASKNNKWPVANEVNVEPFIDTSNWQLLILVSAVSACLLFFVVVNAYLCIYMKKWRHMKQDFEADVEDLSVRINLMQHAGFDADESSNMRNYITQLKGGKSMEKKPKSCTRA